MALKAALPSNRRLRSQTRALAGQHKRAANPQLNPRRSARIRALQSQPFSGGLRAKPQAIFSRSLTPSSTTSEEQRSVRTFANHDALYIPSSPASNGPLEESDIYSTPRRNIDSSDPRPPRQPLIDMLPLGEKSVVTRLSNSNDDLQDAHLAARAKAAEEAAGWETILGIPPGSFNPDTRDNRLLVESYIHIPADRGRGGMVPSIEVLQRLDAAMDKRQLFSAKGDPLPRNDEGFTNYKLVFPAKLREFRFVPLSTWGADKDIVVEVSPGVRKTFKPPFTGKHKIPLSKLHCSPYFVVWQMFVALTSRPNTQAPRYLLREERLIRRIGGKMQAYILQTPR